MERNKLTLNKDKTHLLVMTSKEKHRIHGNFDITLDTGSKIIKPDDSQKLLGGVISSDLKWNKHIKDEPKLSMLKSITSRINALSKITKVSNFKNRKMLANGIVMSKICYLIQLWGGCNEFLLTLLQKLQNRAARLVTRLGWYTPIPTLLTHCGWLSVRQLVVYHSLLQVFKTRNSKLPLFLHEKISNEFKYNTRLAAGSGMRLENKNALSEIGKQSFSQRSVLLWNNLPVNIRQSESLLIFKSSLKDWVKNNIPVG